MDKRRGEHLIDGVDECTAILRLKPEWRKCPSFLVQKVLRDARALLRRHHNSPPAFALLPCLVKPAPFAPRRAEGHQCAATHRKHRAYSIEQFIRYPRSLIYN